MVNDAHCNGQDHTMVKVLSRSIQYPFGNYQLEMVQRRRQLPGTQQRRGTLWWIYNGTRTTQQLSQRGTNTAKASMAWKDILEPQNFLLVSTVYVPLCSKFRL